MDNWKTSLDRWLTQTPEEYWGIDESYSEQIWDKIPESEISLEEYEKNETVFLKWEDKLAKDGKSVEEAHKIILRAYKIYL